MRQAKIYYKGEWAGILAQDNHGHYTFRYTEDWLRDGDKPPISLTLPKSTEAYRSDHFFPFFYNMLPEGANKQLVCKSMRLDPVDYFGLLVTTAQFDTVGAITVQKMEPNL